MALTETPPEIDVDHEVDSPHPQTRTTDPTAFEKVVGSGDHRTIGRVFVGFSLLFLALGLALDGALDFNQAASGGWFTSEHATRLALNSQLGLLLVGIVPLLLGLAIAVVPAQLGSPALAFPRAAAASVWLWLGSAIVFLVAVATGGSFGGTEESHALLGNTAVGGMLVALTLGSICVAVTVLSFRRPGMPLRSVPFFSFASMVAASVWVLSFGSAFASVMLGYLTPFGDGSALAKTASEGLGWLTLQPAIFMVFIPVLGIIADVAATAAGSRLRSRAVVQWAIGMSAAMSFGAWTQTAGAQATALWAVASVAVVLPILVVLGMAIDTLMQGKIKLLSPLPFALVAGLLAATGGVVSVVRAISTAGQGNLIKMAPITLTTPVFRFVFAAALLGAIGGTVYWARQLFGSSVPDAPVKGLVALGALAGLLWGAVWLIYGIAEDGQAALASVGGIGALLLSLVAISAAAVGFSARRVSDRGDVLLGDPWGGGGTLEWADDPAALEEIASAYPVLDSAKGTN